MRRSWLLTAMVTMLGATLPGCRRPPPPSPEPPVAESHERPVGIRTTGEVPILNAAGELVWLISGEVRTEWAGDRSAVEVSEARAESKLPGREVAARAGRARYTLDTDEVVFDHRLFLSAPARRASLEAEQALFVLSAKQFRIERWTRARYGNLVLTAEQVTAEIDLRTLSGLRLEAGPTTAPAGETWTIRAAEGHAEESGAVRFATVSGTIVQGGTTVTFEAPSAAWKPATEWLNFERGATIRTRDATIRATGATWRRREQLVVTRGETVLTEGELRAIGTGGRVDLSARVAVLEAINVAGRRGVLRARRGTLTNRQQLTLVGLAATLPDGVTATADEAVYDHTRGRLVLTRGASAARADATMRAARVVWDATAGSLVASGGVRLAARGVTVTGGSLTAPADLSSATLTPVEGTGGTAGGRWTVRAQKGRWTSAGTTLVEPRGRFVSGSHEASARSSRVRYDPVADTLDFEGGFEAYSASDGIDLRADRAVYDVRRKVFRAIGAVEVNARGIAIRDREWTYHLGGDPSGRLGHGATRSKLEEDPPSGESNDGRRAPAEVAGEAGKGDRAGAVGDQGAAVRGAAAGDS